MKYLYTIYFIGDSQPLRVKADFDVTYGGKYRTLFDSNGNEIETINIMATTHVKKELITEAHKVGKTS